MLTTRILTAARHTGRIVGSEPLDDEHVVGLRAAVQDGHIPDLWYASAWPSCAATWSTFWRGSTPFGLSRMTAMRLLGP